MVAFARERGILCQGRGSAANSVVCYVLGITAVDPIKFDLPFERFLSTTREEEPDIDVDFDSDRREEVIQEVYRRYGRHNAAQVANVISYRPRSAVRDMAKALGYSTGQQDAWSKQIDTYASIADADHDVPEPVVDLANQLLKAPRHLGIHSGGMVLTERPVGEVCPIERGRMDARTVLQWDKDSCAAMGLVKFDFLGLGILAAIQYTFDLVADRPGERWTLQTLPKEEAGVYDMLCRADSIGVFQVESRAQIGTLPRLQPRRFYDLVVEIGLIRPGPIQGGAVHPYIRRATGKEEITYLHPALEPVLKRTLGRAAVPGAADADRHDHRRLHRRRRRPAAPGDGLQARPGEDRAAGGEAVQGDGEATASPGSWPTTSTTGSRPSPTSASPRATRSASGCWCTPRPGSSCTTRGRSWPVCCGPSRWASTPRSPWSPTPGGTAYACAGRTSPGPGCTPSSSRCVLRRSTGS